MTLLLNLIGPHGIHQSSDYRLTKVTTRRPIEDEFGSKQAEYHTATWDAYISFTGFAQIGSRKTRDWILECLGQTSHTDAPTAMARLAERAAVELRGIPREKWFLTIVAAVLELNKSQRLFVVSCVDRPAKPPLSKPLDHFEVHEFSTDGPRELILGSVDTVTRADKKFLEQLNRGTTDPEKIRQALADINARSADRSNGTVSRGCYVKA
jgi:hypothetical protein